MSLLFGAPVPLNVYLILGLGPFKCVPSFHHRPELSSLLLQSSTPFLAQNPVFSRHASDYWALPGSHLPLAPSPGLSLSPSLLSRGSFRTQSPASDSHSPHTNWLFWPSLRLLPWVHWCSRPSLASLSQRAGVVLGCYWRQPRGHPHPEARGLGLSRGAGLFSQERTWGVEGAEGAEGALRCLWCSPLVLEVKRRLTLTSAQCSDSCVHILSVIHVPRLWGVLTLVSKGILHCSKWKLDGHREKLSGLPVS